MKPEKIAELRKRAGAGERLWWHEGKALLEHIDEQAAEIEALKPAIIAADANAKSMEYMQKLLRFLVPERKRGCLCDGCVLSLIEAQEAKEKP
jgi:hypothetical protein